MKKFILRLLIFFCICALFDFLIGICLQFLSTHSKSGNTYKMEHIITNLNEEIVFLGSSRCLHNYNPSIIEDSLNIKSYNCGIEGTGIITFYPLIKYILHQKHPKYIIYDVYNNYDLLVGEDNYKYLSAVKPYYFNMYKTFDIYKTFNIIDKSEEIKLLSSLYRYNSKLFTTINDFFNSTIVESNGYKPLHGEMQSTPLNTPSKIYKYDNIKIDFIKLLILECKNKKTELIFCISPSYKSKEHDSYKILYDIAKENKIPILNHLNDSTYTKMYFYDSVHLNEKGTKKYTSEIAHEIKKIIQNRNKSF